MQTEAGNGDVVFRGRVFANRWRVERPLSSGGMGSVFVASHTGTGRNVALKVIRTESISEASREEFVARFRAETKTLAGLSHPNIVTFHDSGVEDGSLFLVMELLAGTSLRAQMMPGAMPWRRAVRIAGDIARGLAAVHAAGTVHRDLKPENVVLQSSVGHEDFVKLIDFGIAKSEESDLTGAALSTQTGRLVGTPGYMSPEQLQGHRPAPASDIYALGVVLYEMVTGRFPFVAPNIQAMLVKQLFEAIPAAGSLVALPPHIDRLIERLIARAPEERPQSASEALSVLVDALDTAHTPPPPAGVETLTPQRPSLVAMAIDAKRVSSDVAVRGDAPSRWRHRFLPIFVGNSAGIATVAVVAILFGKPLTLPPSTEPTPQTPEAVAPLPFASTAPMEGVKREPERPSSNTPKSEGENVRPQLHPKQTPREVAASTRLHQDVVPAEQQRAVAHAAAPDAAMPALPDKNAVASPEAETVARFPPRSDVVNAFFRAHAAELLDCGGDGERRKLEFIVLGSGEVRLVRPASDAPIACVQTHVRRWRFAPFHGPPPPVTTVETPLGRGTRAGGAR